VILEFQNAADAFEVESLGRQPGDLAQLHDVAHRVSPRLSLGAPRADEAELVVLPQRLRVHAAQLRRDSDREQRAVLVDVGHD
jgi:hypothetical protein